MSLCCGDDLCCQCQLLCLVALGVEAAKVLVAAQGMRIGYMVMEHMVTYTGLVIVGVEEQ